MKNIPNDRNTLIWLNSIGISSISIRKIMENLKALALIWTMDAEDLRKTVPISKKSIEKIIYSRDIQSLEDFIKRNNELNIEIITILDNNYPQVLKDIPDRPKILYRRGKDIRDDFSMAIVGARKSTSYGAWVCSKFSRELVEMGVSIVSGMASGIDAIAHRQALESKGYTLAVLGSGLDVIYPKRNKGLYEDILLEGSLLSEYPIGTQPKPYNFPMRNRIISGLSQAVIVVEAKEKSGSLITAHHALDQGRDVFAVPGNIDSIFSSGTNKLIVDGAIPLLNIRDIINQYDQLEARLCDRLEAGPRTDYSDLEIRLLKVLEEAKHTDKIVYEMQLDIASVNTVLVGLELKGAVKEVGNNVFMKS